MQDTLVLTALTLLVALVMGLLLALLGYLKLALARRPDQADSRVRLLLNLLNLALIPLLLFAGLLVDLLGVRPVLVSGCVLLALSFFALTAGVAYTRAVTAVLCATAGAAALFVSGIVLLPRGIFGKYEMAASLQLGFVFVALGALFTPPILDLLLQKIRFRKTMAALAFLVLLPAFLVPLVPATSFPELGSRENLLALLEYPTIWLAALVFFFYAPLEAFVGVWVTTYLTGARRPDLVSWWLSCFWLAVIGSRLFVGLIKHAANLEASYGFWFLVLPALFSAVMLGNMSASTIQEKSFIGLILLGVFLGPLYPMLLGLTFRLPEVEPIPGTAYGLLHAAGSVGCLALSPLVTRCAKAESLQRAMLIPMYIALLLTGATLLFSMFLGYSPRV